MRCLPILFVLIGLTFSAGQVLAPMTKSLTVGDRVSQQMEAKLQFKKSSQETGEEPDLVRERATGESVTRTIDIDKSETSDSNSKVQSNAPRRIIRTFQGPHKAELDLEMSYQNSRYNSQDSFKFFVVLFFILILSLVVTLALLVAICRKIFSIKSERGKGRYLNINKVSIQALDLQIEFHQKQVYALKSLAHKKRQIARAHQKQKKDVSCLETTGFVEGILASTEITDVLLDASRSVHIHGPAGAGVGDME